MTTPITTTATTTALPSSTGVWASLLAVLGMLAAAFPNAPVLKTFTELLPQLHTIVAALAAALGTVLTLFSHPPAALTSLVNSLKS